MNILDEYVMEAPADQNSVDLFRGEWVSRIPWALESGKLDLFSDGRVKRIVAAAGGLSGQRVLELDPFEGGHTAIMLEMGASEVLAIEANSRAFLRCLIVKEILGRDRARFLLGDFNEHLPTEQPFDFILASGVLYHARNSVRTIHGLTRSSGTIGIWSQYYSETEVREKQGASFSHEPIHIEYEGASATCFAKDYGAALQSKSYCGGGNKFALWMDRCSWFKVFETFGFNLEILSEGKDHPNGPQFTAIARRKGSDLP